MITKNKNEKGEMGGGEDIAVEENAPGNKAETGEGNQSQEIGTMGGSYGQRRNGKRWQPKPG